LAPTAADGASPGVDGSPPGSATAPPPGTAALEPTAAASAAAAPALTTGSASAAPAARSGILKAGEADRFLAKGQATRVRLLDAGGEPRSPLRYALETGRTSALEMGLTMTIELAQGARNVPSQKIPRIATLLDLTTAAAPTGGALGVEAVVRGVAIAEDAGLPQQVADKLLPHLQGIQGLTLGYLVTPEGRVRQAAARMPGKKGGPADATLQQMSQSLESMIAPFPDEAVGVGARWEVVARFDSSGTELLQWSTFELRERDEAGAHLGLEVLQAAARAEVSPPNLPPDVTARLVDFGSRGAGESRVDFTTPAPRVASMKVDSTMTLEVSQAGGTPGPRTSMKSSMLVDLTRKGRGAAGAPPAAAPASPATKAP